MVYFFFFFRRKTSFHNQSAESVEIQYVYIRIGLTHIEIAYHGPRGAKRLFKRGYAEEFV